MQNVCKLFKKLINTSILFIYIYFIIHDLISYTYSINLIIPNNFKKNYWWVDLFLWKCTKCRHKIYIQKYI